MELHYEESLRKSTRLDARLRRGARYLRMCSIANALALATWEMSLFDMELSDGKSSEASEGHQRRQERNARGKPDYDAPAPLPPKLPVGALTPALLLLDSSQFGWWTGHARESPCPHDARAIQNRQFLVGRALGK